MEEGDLTRQANTRSPVTGEKRHQNSIRNIQQEKGDEGGGERSSRGTVFEDAHGDLGNGWEVEQQWRWETPKTLT